MRRLTVFIASLALCGSLGAQELTVNRGLTGNWYNPETNGQGLMIEVFPEQQSLFAVWFTFEPSGGKQLWLTGTGDYEGNKVSFDLLQRSGANFDRPGEPSVTTWGSATLSFDSCTTGTFEYQQVGSTTTSTIPIQRIAPDVSCESGTAPPGAQEAKSHEVFVVDDRFIPEVLTVQAGDTVTWVSGQGNHVVNARDNANYGDLDSGALERGDRYSYTFDQPASEVIYGSDGDDGMTGAVVVEPAFAMNFGVSGSWYVPEKSGQGFLIEYVPTTQVVVVGWFTYSPDDGTTQWMSASRPADRNNVTIPLRRPIDGALNDPTPPTQPDWGSLKLTFHSCSEVTATYESRPDLVSGQIKLQRIAPAPDCEG